MMRIIFMPIAATLLLMSSQASAQYVRGQAGGNFNIYPAGTTAYYVGSNNYQSPYFYLPTVVNSGYYGPSGIQPESLSTAIAGIRGYYVPANGVWRRRVLFKHAGLQRLDLLREIAPTIGEPSGVSRRVKI